MKRNTFVLRRKERALPAWPWHVPTKRAAVLLSSWCHVNYASPCESSLSDAQLLGGKRLSLGEAWKFSHPKLSQVLLSNIDIVIAVFKRAVMKLYVGIVRQTDALLAFFSISF